MTLEALRRTIGDADFDALLLAWPTQHRYGNASTADFVDLAEQVSGEELSAVFDDWLYEADKPAPPP